MRKFIFYLIIFIALVVALFFVTNANITSILIGIITSIIFIVIIKIADSVENTKYRWISIRYRNTLIRFSISYLLRIKIDDKYLLIRGARYPQFQPVGGVFKRYSVSNSFFQEIGVLDDALLPIDEKSKGDLRVRVKGKHIVSFLDWFDSGKEREVSAWREFYEELIEPNLFPEELFPFIRYQYVRRYEHPLRYSDYTQSQELLIAEIYELVPTKEQEEFLRETIEMENESLAWVTEDRIQRRGVIPKKDLELHISEHSQWII